MTYAAVTSSVVKTGSWTARACSDESYNKQTPPWFVRSEQSRVVARPSLFNERKAERCTSDEVGTCCVVMPRLNQSRHVQFRVGDPALDRRRLVADTASVEEADTHRVLHALTSRCRWNGYQCGWSHITLMTSVQQRTDTTSLLTIVDDCRNRRVTADRNAYRRVSQKSREYRWWRHLQARFTLHTTPYVDARTWTYGTVSRCTLTQDTADANYMLLTVVVSGHNCVAVIATQRAASSIWAACCIRLCTMERCCINQRAVDSHENGWSIGALYVRQLKTTI